MSRKRAALAAAFVVAATIVVGAAILPSGTHEQAQAARQPTVDTAQVQKRTLSATVSLSGTLAYRARPDGSPYAVINQASGIYTMLPAAGRVISQGHALYRVNNSPVVLLYGSTPAYRTLSAGVSGPDVAELNADLVALGYTTRAQLGSRSAPFGSATTTAVEKLQAALGVTQNGKLALGQVVFEPTAMRVTTISAQPGDRAQTGQPVMQATSTTREVQVALDAAQQTEVAVGDRVTITLPNDRTTPGVVSSVGKVATCPSSSGSSGSTSTSAATGADTCSAANSGGSTPTVAVGVTPSKPAATGAWDQAPVQIGITTASAPNALVVPVTALLARSAGGYAVEVIGAGAKNHLVPVSLGLFDDAAGMVQVKSSQLTAGQKVVVPAT